MKAKQASMVEVGQNSILYREELANLLDLYRMHRRQSSNLFQKPYFVNCRAVQACSKLHDINFCEIVSFQYFTCRS